MPSADPHTKLAEDAVRAFLERHWPLSKLQGFIHGYFNVASRSDQRICSYQRFAHEAYRIYNREAAR